MKYYGGADRFSDPKTVATAPVQKIDLIKVGDKYTDAINMIAEHLKIYICLRYANNFFS